MLAAAGNRRQGRRRLLVKRRVFFFDISFVDFVLNSLTPHPLLSLYRQMQKQQSTGAMAAATVGRGTMRWETGDESEGSNTAKQEVRIVFMFLFSFYTDRPLTPSPPLTWLGLRQQR